MKALRILLFACIIVLLGCKESPKSNTEMDVVLRFDQMKIQQKATYTGGGKLENGKTQTNGIYITKVTETTIKYSLVKLINWKEEFEQKGTAKLERTSDSIVTQNNRKEPAFTFIDASNNWIIYLTKNKTLSATKSKVYHTDGTPISKLMFYK